MNPATGIPVNRGLSHGLDRRRRLVGLLRFMKPIVYALFMILTSSPMEGQGLVKMDNLSTNSGLVSYFSVLLAQDVNVQLNGGPKATGIKPIHTWLLSDGSAWGINVAPGRLADPQHAVYAVPDVAPGDPAFILLQIWPGMFKSYNDALTAGAPVGQTEFFNPTGQAGTEPDLVSMPSWGLAALETPPVVYAMLHISVNPTGKVTITWPVGTLVSAPTLVGPYTDVPAATSPYVVTPSPSSRMFYRLRQ